MMRRSWLKLGNRTPPVASPRRFFPPRQQVAAWPSQRGSCGNFLLSFGDPGNRPFGFGVRVLAGPGAV
jgi:hypothetical protein